MGGSTSSGGDPGLLGRLLPLILSTFPLAAVGCGEGSGAGPVTEPVDGVPSEELAVELVASGLEVPWALAFAPDGRLFLTERPGRIRVVEGGRLRREPWAEIDVAQRSETGLMGIALAPDFATSGRLYVVATFEAGGGLENRVLRFTERNGMGSMPEVIISGLPASNIHAGGGLAFGPDGMLYVTAGDAREPSSAQEFRSLGGKILRYTPDGGVPRDNPFPGSPVYARGVRNPQGLAWHPVEKVLFATEHGPSGEEGKRDHDELNVIREGDNYGWPTVIGTGDDRFTPPIAVWTPAVAPNGVAFYTGTAIPEWRNNAFVGGLRGEQLRRIVVAAAPRTPAGWRVTAEEALFEDEYGRIRLVAMGPDGNLYFGTSNRDGRGRPANGDDRIFRIVRR